ncbi:MAG: vWA domain-containing protein, partial [Pyrinomonadaceae bacterium]
QREVMTVEASKASFNLILLLDVSGSVDERLDFIRHAALDFVDTSSAQDKIAIISFHNDVKLISDFTTDRQLLRSRLRDLEAGGSTALYDALAYVLVKTLKPLRGERTAIVILSDGDDNRSFIPFNALPGEILESGASIYPVYVPSQLSNSDVTPSLDKSSDPTRSRYLALTTQANREGGLLASISGGVFYPVTRLADLQRAYDDIVRQLQGSYSVTYLSRVAKPEDRRLRIRTIREGSVARIGQAQTPR